MDGLKFFIEAMGKAIKVLVIIVIVCVVALIVGGVKLYQAHHQDSAGAENAPAPSGDTKAAPVLTAAPVAMVIVTAADPTCEDTDPERAKRNVVWRTLNGELLPDSPERALALGLLPFTRTENGTLAIQDGMDRIVNRFTAYYTMEQRTRMFETLRVGDPDDKVETVRRILVADRAATNLLECILRDEDRMQLVLDRKPVPLE